MVDVGGRASLRVRVVRRGAAAEQRLQLQAGRQRDKLASATVEDRSRGQAEAGLG